MLVYHMFPMLQTLVETECILKEKKTYKHLMRSPETFIYTSILCGKKLTTIVTIIHTLNNFTSAGSIKLNLKLNIVCFSLNCIRIL